MDYQKLESVVMVDTFHRDKRIKFTDEDTLLYIERLKDVAEDLEVLITRFNNRHMSISMTHLEICVEMAMKGAWQNYIDKTRQGR